MRQWIGSHLTYANVMVTILAFVVLGGMGYAATGGNLILGKPNAASSTSSLSAPVSGKALNLTNTSTGAGATALGLNVASGHAPFTVNSGAKVANLNADKLDGLDSGSFQKNDCQPTVPGTGEMVKVGPTCIDKYEDSVWSSPTGGTQYGVPGSPIPCSGGGQNCDNIYARSVPGVEPSRFITWFQAARALANSGKRLPTNAEWQVAASGTPEGTCNADSGGGAFLANTGDYQDCVSAFGARDMVGNVSEWVADWDEAAGTGCAGWGPGTNGTNYSCIGRADSEASNHLPAAFLRGGNYQDPLPAAGEFSITAVDLGSATPLDGRWGFRGAR